MRYWLGAFLFAVSAYLLYRGYAHRTRVLALAPAAELHRRREAAADDPRSMAAMGEIARPIVLLLLAWTGLKTTAAFAMMGGQRYFAWFDLAGFLTLLGAYGTLLTLQTRYRMLDALAIRREAEVGAAAPALAAVEPVAPVTTGDPTPAATRAAA